MAQYLSTETATRQKIDTVHKTTSSDTVNKQAYKFDGKPYDAIIANGIPNKPTKRSATAKEMM